ncbi:MAG: hypothetical protein ACR2NL_05410 [Acidimicrobiia bacterium]
MHEVAADWSEWLERVSESAARHQSVVVFGSHSALEAVREPLAGVARAHASVEFDQVGADEARPDVVAVAPQPPHGNSPSLPMQLVETVSPESNLLYVGRRAPFVAVVAQHKSGTHLVARLLEGAGYQPFGIGVQEGPPPDGFADWISWENAEFDGLAENTAYFNHTLPFMALRKPGEEYRTLLKRWLAAPFPLLFHYRDPRAVLSSVMRYCTDQTVGSPSSHGAWIQVVGDVLKGMPDDDARLTATLELLGDYMQRQYRENLWMLWHPAVCRTSYEELAGPKAGGSELDQRRAVARVMVRLGISGSPDELADSLYATDVRTFSRGRIAGWQEDFGDHHLDLFERRFGDLRELYGY